MNIESILNKYKKHLIDSHHFDVNDTRSFHDDYRNLRFYNRSFTDREKFNPQRQKKIEAILCDLVPKVNDIQKRLKKLEIPVTITSNNDTIIIISNTYRYNGNSGYPHTIEQDGSLFSKNTHLEVDIIKYVVELSFNKNFHIIEDFVFFILEEVSADEFKGYGVGARKVKMSLHTEPISRIHENYSNPSDGIFDIILKHIAHIVDITCKEHG